MPHLSKQLALPKSICRLETSNKLHLYLLLLGLQTFKEAIYSVLSIIRWCRHLYKHKFLLLHCCLYQINNILLAVKFHNDSKSQFLLLITLIIYFFDLNKAQDLHHLWYFLSKINRIKLINRLKSRETLIDNLQC